MEGKYKKGGDYIKYLMLQIVSDGLFILGFRMLIQKGHRLLLQYMLHIHSIRSIQERYRGE
jgi:hypothetical protein